MKFKLKTIVAVLLFTCMSTLSFAQEGKVTVEQDENIAKLLEYKKDLKTVELYKIQVFQGNRSFAEDLKASFESKYNDWPTEMVYETPNYKIWVGNFRSRLEADKALIKIKKNYVNAFIFQPKKESK
jgi:hypothetical protein